MTLFPVDSKYLADSRSQFIVPNNDWLPLKLMNSDSIVFPILEWPSMNILIEGKDPFQPDKARRDVWPGHLQFGQGGQEVSEKSLAVGQLQSLAILTYLDMAMVKLDGPWSSDLFFLPFLNMVVFHINGSLKEESCLEKLWWQWISILFQGPLHLKNRTLKELFSVVPLLVSRYPLVICYMAIENGPVEIVDFPINSMVIFHSYVNVYQRVNQFHRKCHGVEQSLLPQINPWTIPILAHGPRRQQQQERLSQFLRREPQRWFAHMDVDGSVFDSYKLSQLSINSCIYIYTCIYIYIHIYIYTYTPYFYVYTHTYFVYLW